MKPDDRVLYVEDRDSAAEHAVVTHVYPGSIWVAIRTTSGRIIDQVRAAQDRFGSPNGGYCIPLPGVAHRMSLVPPTITTLSEGDESHERTGTTG